MGRNSPPPKVRDSLSCVDEDIERGRQGEAPKRRYSIRESEEGRYLTCVEAPNVSVRIERGLSAPAAAIKRAPSGTIYLDGAAAFEPFMDVQRQVYNLDHHEGCVRPFTLATCEQAMVLVIKGLDLRSGEWTVWANEPDLDTVLAIWVLLNHMRLCGEDSELRRAVMPLIRLEGAIDANGLKYTDMCGFPSDLEDEVRALIDDLRVKELEIKQSGSWSTVNFLEYTAEVLHSIDHRFYSPCAFEETPDVDEILRVAITDNRMAVVCRSESGIYEVEKGLSLLHGNNVGLIILQKNPRTYTLRQVDPFLPVSLDVVYERLNLIDSSVGSGGEADRWGGSSEIGGSPRKSGTALTPAEIARACQWVYRPPSLLKRVLVAAGAAAGAVGLVALSLLFAAIYSENPSSLSVTTVGRETGVLFATVSGVVTAALLVVFGRRRRRRYGLRLPAIWRWALFLPPAFVVGVIGGAWVIPPPMSDGAELLVRALTLPLICEALYRGMVQGILVDYWNVQRPGGPWFISTPSILTTLLSAVTSSLLFLPAILGHARGPGLWAAPLWVVGALLLGITCSMARERSNSLLPPMLVHLIAALWLVLAPSLI